MWFKKRTRRRSEHQWPATDAAHSAHLIQSNAAVSRHVVQRRGTVALYWDDRANAGRFVGRIRSPNPVVLAIYIAAFRNIFGPDNFQFCFGFVLRFVPVSSRPP